MYFGVLGNRDMLLKLRWLQNCFYSIFQNKILRFKTDLCCDTAEYYSEISVNFKLHVDDISNIQVSNLFEICNIAL